jgi:hypothetical protein
LAEYPDCQLAKVSPWRNRNSIRADGLISGIFQVLDKSNTGFWFTLQLEGVAGGLDPALGSFRSLLLHALSQYMIDEHRKEGTKKRIPKDKMVRLDTKDTEIFTESMQAFDPEESFNYAWRVDMLDRALNEVKDSYTTHGMELHWHLFYNQVLSPILQGQESPPLKNVLLQYGLESTAVASHMLTTVKRRLQNVLKRQVRQMALTSEAMEEELREIQKFFQKDCAQ